MVCLQVKILSAVHDEMRELEAMYMSEATSEMIIYGMCYKRGHVRKNWSIRNARIRNVCKYQSCMMLCASGTEELVTAAAGTGRRRVRVLRAGRARAEERVRALPCRLRNGETV